jgi:hypothetical protein
MLIFKDYLLCYALGFGSISVVFLLFVIGWMLISPVKNYLFDLIYPWKKLERICHERQSYRH